MSLIKLEDYDIQEEISDDKLGFSFSAIEKQTGKLVELRVIDSFYFLYSNIPFFQEAMNTLCQLNLPGLVKIHGYRLPLTKEEKKQYKTNPQMIDIRTKFTNQRIDFYSGLVVTDFERYHHLDEITRDYLEYQGKGSKLNSTIRSKIIFGIASIMKHAHQKGLVHCDLNLSYVYLDEKFEPKIANFGSVRTAFNSMFYPEHPCGCGYKPTLLIIPDKSEDEDDYENLYLKKEYDVFLFGLLIFQMFEINSRGFIRNFCRGKPFKKPDSFVNNSYWDLIVKCMKNQKEKPSFDEIVEELKNDKFAIQEFGMKTDLDALHEYQERIYYN